MASSRRKRRIFGLVAAASATVLTAAGPAAMAQDTTTPTTPPTTLPAAWQNSQFTATDLATADGATRTTTQFDLSGVFVRTARGGAVTNTSITDVDYRFAANEVDGFDLPADEDCLPDDVAAEIADPPSQPAEPNTVRAEFDTPRTDVPDEPAVDTITWPCNGRFTVTATAAYGSDTTTIERQSLVATITVAVPPPAPSAVVATADGMAITVRWDPVAETARQVIGYRVERAGPADADGSYGTFTPIGADFAPDAARTITDTIDDLGAYRYRVRTIRDGVDGPILSAATEKSRAEIDLSPTTTTTPGSSTTVTKPTVPGLGAGGKVPKSGSSNLTPTRPSPTTIDLGFDPTIDYGDIPEPGGDDFDLAGESGSSIINIDEPGAGLAIPFAGALVLLGWAGHIFYLNRLARQF